MNTIWIAVAVFSILGMGFGSILGYALHRFAIKEDPIIEKVNELLPQIQCRQCGYAGCRPYAEAMSLHGEKINRCFPGGEAVKLKIATLLDIESQQLNRDKEKKEPLRTLAFINEFNCIGCTKCIQVCPVDAIVGTARAMHTVITDLCIGCNLCVIPCPTQCIELRSVETISNRWNGICNPY